MPVTQSGIEIATLRFVAQCFNHLCRCFPNCITTYIYSYLKLIAIIISTQLRSKYLHRQLNYLRPRHAPLLESESHRASELRGHSFNIINVLLILLTSCCLRKKGYLYLQRKIIFNWTEISDF